MMTQWTQGSFQGEPYLYELMSSACHISQKIKSSQERICPASAYERHIILRIKIELLYRWFYDDFFK